MNLRGFVNFLLSFLECFATSSDGVACYLYNKSAPYIYIRNLPLNSIFSKHLFTAQWKILY